MNLGLKGLGLEGLHDTKEVIRLPYVIAGNTHTLRINIDFGVVKQTGWPIGAFTGFNKFLANSDKLLETGFKNHVNHLGEYLDPKFCAANHDPEPTYENFRKMIKLTTAVFSKAYDRSKHGQFGNDFCALCGEMPWDPEHGLGIVLNSSGVVVDLMDYMSAYEYCC